MARATDTRDARQPMTTASSHSRSSISVAARPHDRGSRIGDRVGELREEHRVGRDFNALFAAVIVVVQPHAHDLSRVGEGREEPELLGRDMGLALVGRFRLGIGQHRQRVGSGEDGAEVGAEQIGQVEDPVRSLEAQAAAGRSIGEG